MVGALLRSNNCVFIFSTTHHKFALLMLPQRLRLSHSLHRSHYLSNVKATKLPLHSEYDCAIDLLPGTMPPRSTFSQGTKGYGGIHKGSSVTAVHLTLNFPHFWRILLGEDGGLRPCRGLNGILIKYPYPLP